MENLFPKSSYRSRFVYSMRRTVATTKCATQSAMESIIDYWTQPLPSGSTALFVLSPTGLVETFSGLCCSENLFLPHLFLPHSLSLVSDLHCSLKAVCTFFPLFFIGISSSKSLGCLIPSWHLLLRGYKLI